MRGITSAFACLLFSAALVASPAEQGKSIDLTGEWKCNIEKSTFPGHPPSAMSASIRDTPTIVEIVYTELRGGTPRTIEMKLDKTGKETITHVGSMEVRTTLTVEDGVMREVATFHMPSGKVVRKSIVKLSEDKKTITKESVYTGPQGDSHEKIILERQ